MELETGVWPAAAYGRVAVLMGGWSAERDVSLASGKAVCAGLQRAGVDAHLVDVDRDFHKRFDWQQYDRAFLILHGRGGEDGVVQGGLDWVGFPYTGTGVLGSALAMDKQRAKQLCQTQGIATPRWHVVDTEQAFLAAVDDIGLPLVVKPTSEGSSVGVSVVREQTQLLPAYQLAAQYGVCLVEQFVQGREITASIVRGRALPTVHMEPAREFYDYAAKYEDSGTQYHCPAGLDEALEMRIRDIALQVFGALSGEGWGRVDFILDDAGQPWFIELNTAPGMTDHSLVPMAAKASGMAFEQLVVEILHTSVELRRER